MKMSQRFAFQCCLILSSLLNECFKVWRYIMRYFFISHDSLCYNKTRKDREAKKKYKVAVDLKSVKEIVSAERKIEILSAEGRKIILKGKEEDIGRYLTLTLIFISQTSHFLVKQIFMRVIQMGRCIISIQTQSSGNNTSNNTTSPFPIVILISYPTYPLHFLSWTIFSNNEQTCPSPFSIIAERDNPDCIQCHAPLGLVQKSNRFCCL